MSVASFTISVSIPFLVFEVAAQFTVVPFAPIASLIAFTTNCTFTSLLPLTTSEAPLFAASKAAVCSIPLDNLASLNAGTLTAPPSLANNARATAPVSEGLCV